MLEKLDFLTPTTLKVLEFFFANWRAEFYEREVIRNTENQLELRCSSRVGNPNNLSAI